MKRKIALFVLVQVAMLVAVEVVLSRFLSISTPVTKIGFAFVPLAVCGMLFGPVWGGVAGGVADFIGAILFPIGPYFPGFTLTNALHGVMFGLFLHRREARWWHIALAVGINQFVLGVFLSAYWLYVMGAGPYWVLVQARVLQGCILFPVQFAVIRLMQAPMRRYAGFAQRYRLI